MTLAQRAGNLPGRRGQLTDWRVDLPVMPPVEPMLAKSVPQLPTAAGMSYEPKWDGFRCIVFRDGDEVELASRGGKTLTRYFPEVVAQVRAQLPARCVVDGEIVVIRRDTGDAEARLRAARAAHPPGRVAGARCSPSRRRPSFVAFDLLALGDDDLIGRPYARAPGRAGRGAGRGRAAGARHPGDDRRRRWRGTGSTLFEGAGLDGLIAKPADSPTSRASG